MGSLYILTRNVYRLRRLAKLMMHNPVRINWKGEEKVLVS